MQASQSINEEISRLLMVEVKLYIKMEYLINMKFKVGEKLMTIEPNEANIRKCQFQLQAIDYDLKPICDQHQKVIDRLKALGVKIVRE